MSNDVDAGGVASGAEAAAGAAGRDLSRALALEWLESHGDGSWAHGTLALAPTRRRHGLLVVPSATDASVVLSRLDETVVTAEARVDLATRLFEGSSQSGIETLVGFDHRPFPRWTHRIGDRLLEKALFAFRAEGATVVRWRLVEGEACTIEVRPFVPIDAARAQAPADAFRLEESPRSIVLRGPDGPALALGFDGTFRSAPDVWFRFLLPAEGAGERLDLYTPGTLSLALEPGRDAVVVASAETPCRTPAADIEGRERRRRDALVPTLGAVHPELASLARSADVFHVEVRGEPTVVASYPTRALALAETAASIVGLTVPFGWLRAAADALSASGDAIVRGLSRRDAIDAPSAALWWVEAVRVLRDAGAERAVVVERLYPLALRMIESLSAGGAPCAALDDDGLLQLADGATSLRREAPGGKPVEIQALWHNALLTTAEIAATCKSMVLAAELRALAKRTHLAFVKHYWDPDRGWLADAVRGRGRDARTDAHLRAHQLVALALGEAMLTPGEAARCVEAVRDKLLEPGGLRVAEGAAVDPWWLGPYARALAVARGGVGPAHREIAEAVDGARAHLACSAREAWDDATFAGVLGQLADPTTPASAPAIAELARVVADLLPPSA